MPRAPRKATPSKKEIGERIRQLRRERGFTQVELAASLGTHQTNLSQMERGVRGVGVQNIVRLAKALKVSPEMLMGPTPPPTGAQRNEKLSRRVRRIEELPREHQEAAIKMLDAFLDTRTIDTNGKR